MNAKKAPASRKEVRLLVMGGVVATLGLVSLVFSLMNGYPLGYVLFSLFTAGIGFLVVMMVLRRRRASGASR